jgi:hypothetical protein
MDLQMRIDRPKGRVLYGDDLRASIARGANTKTPARVVEASKDPRITDIQAKVAQCEPAGERRRNWMYGKTVIPKGYVELIDDLKTAQTPRHRIIALGDSFRDAARESCRDYRVESDVPEALAKEMLVDGEGAAAVALLTRDPNDLTQLRIVAAKLAHERDEADRARDAVIDRIRFLEEQEKAVLGVPS